MAFEKLLFFTLQQSFVFDQCAELQSSVSKIAEKYLNESEIVFFTNTPTIYDSHAFNCLKGAVSAVNSAFTINVDLRLGPFLEITVPKPRNILIYIHTDAIGEFVGRIVNNPYWNARARILVIANNSRDVVNWIKTLWTKTWAVNLIVISLNDKFHYRTWFPYKPHECGKVKTIVSLNFDSLFPPKIGFNLNGCPIIGFSSLVLPFVRNEEEGVEPEIFKTITEKLNLTRKFAVSSNLAYNYLNAYGQLTGTGIMMQNHEIEVMFANLLRGYLNWKYFDLVTSHTEDSLSWFVPAPKPLPRTVGLFMAFSVPLWVAVLFVNLVCLFVSLVFGKITLDSRKFDSFLQTWSLALNLASFEPKSTAFRILITFIYFFSLHITTAYQSSLISFLSNVQRAKPILTIADAADVPDLKVYLLNAYKNVIINISEHDVWEKLLKPGRPFYFQTLPIYQLRQRDAIELAPKLTMTFSLQDKLYMDPYGYPMVVALEKPNFRTAVNFFMSPGHPLFDLFNEYTYWLVQSGLPQHWAQVFMDSRFKGKPPALKQPFGVPNLAGAFIILVAMLMLSFVVFLFEIIYHGYMAKNRRINGKRKRRFFFKSNISENFL